MQKQIIKQKIQIINNTQNNKTIKRQINNVCQKQKQINFNTLKIQSIIQHGMNQISQLSIQIFRKSHRITKWQYFISLICKNIYSYLTNHILVFIILISRLKTISKDKHQDLLSIKKEQNIKKIIKKIKYKRRNISQNILQEINTILNLDKIKIAWITSPFIYIDVKWAIEHFQQILLQNCLHQNKEYSELLTHIKPKNKSRKAKRNRNRNKNWYDQGSDSEDDEVSLQITIISALVSQLNQSVDTGNIPCLIKNLKQMIKYAIDNGTPNQYVKLIFEMTITQALNQFSFTKYITAGKKIQDKFYQYKKQQAFNILNQEQQILKKPSKRMKKNLKKKQNQQKQKLQNKSIQIKQYQIQQSNIKYKQNLQEKIKLEQISIQNNHNIEQIKQIIISQKIIQIQKIKQKKKIKKQKKSKNKIQFQYSNKYKQIINNLMNKQIDKIYQQNQNIISIKNKAIQIIYHFIIQYYPTIKPNIYGSFTTLTSLPTSDIDIYLISIIQSHPQIILQQISNQLMEAPWTTYCKFIKAKIPIIKLIIDPNIISSKQNKNKQLPYQIQVNQKQLIKFDISLNSSNNTAMISTGYICTVITNRPRMRDIYILFKNIFRLRKINEGYLGGFSSYCLFIMIIALIQQKEIDTQSITLFDFFIKFAEFFTKQFQPEVNILRFLKDQSSIVNINQYEDQLIGQNLRKDCRLKLVDPISCKLIQSSFSKYDQFTYLLDKWLRNIEDIKNKYMTILNKIKNQQSQIDIVKLEQMILQSEEMKYFYKGLFE